MLEQPRPVVNEPMSMEKSMITDLTNPVSMVTFTAVDFETTGLYSATDRIVEFGAVRFKGTQVVETFHRLANPGIPMSPGAASICGISDADLIGAPLVADVVPEFLRFIGNSVLIAHNAPFDLGFLRTAVLSAGIVEVANSVIDTQELAIRAFPKRKSYGLQNLALELALPLNRAHRALDDATLCMRLFHRCVEELSFMGEMELGELLTGLR